MTAMLADVAGEAFSEISPFKETLDGIRVATHCLYMSFKPVSVSINRIGDGFRVGDLRGAFDAAWLHGRDERAIGRSLQTEASRFGLFVSDNVLTTDVVTRDWLSSAIVSVANASCNAANAVISRFFAASEVALVDKIEDSLNRVVGPSGFVKEYEVTGKSGGSRKFDFAIRRGESAILINGIAAHHASVSAKYVVFSDTEYDQEQKLAVFDKNLETQEVSLLQQVALVVPLVSLDVGVQRARSYVN